MDRSQISKMASFSVYQLSDISRDINHQNVWSATHLVVGRPLCCHLWCLSPQQLKIMDLAFY